MTKKNKYILAFLSCLALSFVSIQAASALDVGANVVTNTIKLSNDSPIQIASRIINIFMMFLGILAVSLTIFAGFKWMTSAGNEENVAAAKKILKNAVIGLVIILSSWGIVAFILGRLISDTANQGGNIINNTRSGFGLGSGALGSCMVQSVYPEPEQKELPRNTAIIVTFKEDVKLDTVCVNSTDTACACDNTSACNRLNKNNFKIYEGSSQASSTDAIVTHPAGDNKTIVVTPLSPLGSPSDNTWYTTYLSNDIQSASGCPNDAAACGMFDTCATDYYRWQFEVSNKLDLTPPQVVLNGIFPEPDDARDNVVSNSILAAASGSFKVNGMPQAYVSAEVGTISSVPNDAQPGTITLEPNYNETTDVNFSITVMLGDKARLYNGTDYLGVATFENNNVIFPNYLTLAVGGDGSHPVGYMWTFAVTAAQKADTITVGADTYTFVNGAGGGYNISISSNPVQQATNIASILSLRTDIYASINNVNDFVVDIQSKVAGFAGNSINLDTNNDAIITVSPMQGGSDSVQTAVVSDQKDKPMNSTIQINFNEAVNPVTVSGNAGDVSQTIQVVNESSTAQTNGASCTANSDCLSYKCEANTCVGDYVDGKFEISNGYKTVEFRTNNECGMNGCGEKIYCLPADSNLQIKIRTASLVDCAVNDDCAAKAPYNTCADNSGLFKSCRDNSGQNYPLAKITPMIGVMDAAFNALDGNRDGNADGPLSFYYDENVQNDTYKDNYRWSFFVNSQIDATPPKITNIIPVSAGASANLSDPIIIDFDKLIMSSSLKSGSIKLTVGTTTIEHKLLNLKSAANIPTGYWTSSENLDASPLDGQPDMTRARINHSMFGENIDYVSQVGSGVKDIFQNCFKPSSGPSCIATQARPSCCNNTSESILEDGSCAVNN